MTRVSRLIGVYDADGSLVGEMTYLVRSTLGRAHCELCDITHGRLREKRGWREARRRLPVPFDTHHRDEVPEAVRAAAGGVAPVVVGELDGGGHVPLLGPEELAGCAGSPDRLVDAIEAAMRGAGLAFGASLRSPR